MLNHRVIDRAFDVERYVLSKFPDALRSGGNLVVTCPRCEKPKLWILTVDSESARTPSWQCFSGDCHDGGRTAVSLVRRVEGCDAFRALELIQQFQRGNRPLVDLRQLVHERLVDPGEVWDDKPVDRVALPDGFVAIAPGTKPSEMPPYFRERGIGPKKALRYGLGVCHEGRYRNRLVVPVTSEGEVAFFVARYMRKKPPFCAGPHLPCKRCGGDAAHVRLKKTLYPKGAKPGRFLFNYDRARHEPTIRVVEGALDAIHLGKSAVATFGTNLSQYQLELLMRTAATEIIILWDRDAIDKARELADRLADLWTIRVVELPDERDPDEHDRADLIAMEAAAKPLDASGARRNYVIGRLGA